MSEKKMVIALLRSAVDAEDKGVRIFLELASKVKSLQVKRLFQRLSKDEERHSEMCKNLLRLAMRSDKWDMDDPVVIQNLGLVTLPAFEQIDPFPQSGLDKLEPTTTLTTALKTTFEIEKRQYLTFKELAEEFSEPVAQSIVSRLANEERQHALDIAEEYNRIVKLTGSKT
jgi:rubrerythrin